MSVDVIVFCDFRWYYLWNESFWEFLLSIFILYFFYLVIMNTSFGKKNLQKYVDMANHYAINPVISALYQGMNDFVIGPISKQLLKETGFNMIKWWYQIEDNPDHDNSGMDEDDILSEEDEAYFEYAKEQFDFENEE